MPFHTFKNNQSYVSAATMDADITGDTIDASGMNSCSMTCVNTAGTSPVGTLYIQISNDQSTWVNTTATAAINAAETNVLEITALTARFVRIFYDFTSGTAALSVAFTMKS